MAERHPGPPGALSDVLGIGPAVFPEIVLALKLAAAREARAVSEVKEFLPCVRHDGRIVNDILAKRIDNAHRDVHLLGFAAAIFKALVPYEAAVRKIATAGAEGGT